MDDDKRFEYESAILEVSQKIPSNGIKVELGKEVTLSKFQESGFNVPFLVKDGSKLGLTVPPITPELLISRLGEDFTISVIDVAKQRETLRQWQLKDWCKLFFDRSPEDRQSVYNVISLECSASRFAEDISIPDVVKKIGWVEQHWPSTQTLVMPRTGLYCLMSMRGSWTDFHVDFGGTSVWYHIAKGEKLFFLAPPTKQNLLRYKERCEKNVIPPSPRQSSEWFFGTALEDLRQVRLQAGDTFFLPAGWIHAVFTPIDSIAIGGNFLHGFNMQVQFQIDEMDRTVQLDRKFQFPSFAAVNWYASSFYLRCLKMSLHEQQKPPIYLKKSSDSSWVLPAVWKLSSLEFQGVKCLFKKLSEWVKRFERPGALKDWDQQSKAAAFMASQRLGYENPLQMMSDFHRCITLCSDKTKPRDKSDPDISIPIKAFPLAKISASARKRKRNSEDESSGAWIISCPCGIALDDGRRMISCDECDAWSHTICNGIADESSPPESFVCRECLSKVSNEVDWYVDCCCGLCAKNYDDGWRMVYCPDCCTWQHTICVGIPKDEEPFDNYVCSRCKISTAGGDTKNRAKLKKIAGLNEEKIETVGTENKAVEDDLESSDADSLLDEDFRPTANSRNFDSSTAQPAARIRIVIPSPLSSTKNATKGSTVRQRLDKKLKTKSFGFRHR